MKYMICRSYITIPNDKEDSFPAELSFIIFYVTEYPLRLSDLPPVGLLYSYDIYYMELKRGTRR